MLPQGAGQWLAVLGLGLMPVGAAFYAWDHGVKRGNIQVLGAASYAAPLLSTLVLIATGFAEPSLSILAACLLITAGAVLAAKSLLFGRSDAPAEARPDAVSGRHRGHGQRHADPVGRRGDHLRTHRQHAADARQKRGEDARRRRFSPCWSLSRTARSCCLPRWR